MGLFFLTVCVKAFDQWKAYSAGVWHSSLEDGSISGNLVPVCFRTLGLVIYHDGKHVFILY